MELAIDEGAAVVMPVWVLVFRERKGFLLCLLPRALPEHPAVSPRAYG